MAKKFVWGAAFLLLACLSVFLGAAEASLTTPEGLAIFFISRLPRLLSILITGMSMAVAGLIMQQLSQNKFASPSTAGTIESASLGIMVALIFFGESGSLVRIAIAFGFALAGSWLFLELLRRVVFKDAMFIPLLGIMLGKVISAVTTFLAYKYDLLQSLGGWLHGDFSGILAGRYELLYFGIPATAVAYFYAHQLTIAGFGEDFSHSLGLDYSFIRRLGLALVALLTSIVVLTVGEIPFIGLIIPNLVTLARGDNVRENLPYVAFFGAAFVLASDVLGRSLLHPYEISVSLILGVAGGAMFLYFLLRRKLYA